MDPFVDRRSDARSGARLFAAACDALDDEQHAKALQLATAAVGSFSRVGAEADCVNARLLRVQLRQALDQLEEAAADAAVALSLARMLPVDQEVGARLLVQALLACGGTEQAVGAYDRAEELFEEALATGTALLSWAHVDVCSAHCALGVLFKAMGRYDEADAHYAAALAGLNANPHDRPMSRAAVLHNLGGLAHARGDAGAAEPHARAALHLVQKLAPAGSMAVAREQAALAPILIDLQRYDEASDLLEASEATYVAALGAQHYEVGVSRHNRGMLCQRRGDDGAAVVLLEQAVAIKERAQGANHPDLGISHFALGVSRARLGDEDRAASALNAACRVLRPHVGEEHPVLVGAVSWLGRLGDGRPS